jgi:iron(III) transport system ATP-binding protein
MNNIANVVLDHVSKEFTTPDGARVLRAVDDISVQIATGKFITLLGPSGCGKTTLLRMIAGFEIPTQGNIYLGEQRINDLPPNKRDTAMVFQSYALFPHYTVYENIAFGLKIKNLPATVIEEKVSAILALVGLDGLEGRAPSQLSGGQQQRVALARALVMQPAVLLFDEPLSNLDAKLRVYMRKEIRKIQRDLGITSIYVTHDQAEAMSLSDEVIVMNRGKIEQIGSPGEIYQYPATEFVADFIGTANFIPGIIREIRGQTAAVDVWGQTVTVPLRSQTGLRLGGAVKLIVRPEAIELGKEGQFAATVLASTFMGSVQEYTLMIGDIALQAEVANPRSREIYAEGNDVKVSFRADSLHLIGCI